MNLKIKLFKFTITMSKKVYKKLDPITHILERPDMYCGSVRPKKVEDYIVIKDEENN